MQHIIDFFISGAHAAFADDIKQGFTDFGDVVFGVGASPRVTIQTPALVVATVIRFMMGGSGIVFMILTLYAGFKWQNAAGNDEQVEIAKKTLTRAIIGIIVSVAGIVFLGAIQLILERASLTGAS